MITINNIEYENYDIKVSWREFFATDSEKSREGIAPFITFIINDDKFVVLEFIISDEMFKQMKVNVKTNVEEYISDILYEDGKGWISIIDSEYDCDITRIDKKCFEINFYIRGEENIFIYSKITLL